MNQLKQRIIRLLEIGEIKDRSEREKFEYLLKTKKWNPYCIRHSAITADSDYLPEYALKKKVRWSINSKQGSRYIKTSINLIVFSMPSKNSSEMVTMSIAMEQLPRNITALEEYVQIAENLTKAVFPNATIVIPTQPQTLGGLPAYAKVFTFVHPETEMSFTVGQIFTVYNGKAYVLSYTAQSEIYNVHYQAFQDVINSFQITY